MSSLALLENRSGPRHSGSSSTWCSTPLSTGAVCLPFPREHMCEYICHHLISSVPSDIFFFFPGCVGTVVGMGGRNDLLVSRQSIIDPGIGPRSVPCRTGSWLVLGLRLMCQIVVSRQEEPRRAAILRRDLWTWKTQLHRSPRIHNFPLSVTGLYLTLLLCIELQPALVLFPG